MTTYTITGIKLSGYVNGLPTAVAPTEMKIVLSDADTTFSYEVISSSPGNLPEINLTSTAPYAVTFDGVDAEQLFNNVNDLELAGYMNWSGGTTYLLDFYSDSQGADYVFGMGGAALPALNTVAEATTLSQSITGMGPIASGPYEPGAEIAFANLQNVQMTENDVFSGTDADDLYSTGIGNDVVRAGLGDDSVSGNQGTDKLWGQGGADKLSGGGGNDKLYGGLGADVLSGGAGRDKLFGGNSLDRLYGNGGNDALFGNNGNDKLYGNLGNDRLLGGGGNDLMLGGGGNDKLTGGKGNDFMRGGAGSDVFVFNASIDEGTDTIGDFTVGADLIRIGGGITFADVTISENLDGALASWGGTSVLFKGISGADLTTDSFDFI